MKDLKMQLVQITEEAAVIASSKQDDKGKNFR